MGSHRLHRLHPKKTEVRIFDYVDRSVPMLFKMFENRLRGYRAIGYARDESPLGFAPPPEEPTIEYDEEALRHFDEDESRGPWLTSSRQLQSRGEWTP